MVRTEAAGQGSLCVCGNPGCPSDGGGFYVTLKEEVGEAMMAGPFETHQESMDALPDAFSESFSTDPLRSGKWRTVRKMKPPHPPGALNERLGIRP